MVHALDVREAETAGDGCEMPDLLISVVSAILLHIVRRKQRDWAREKGLKDRETYVYYASPVSSKDQFPLQVFVPVPVPLIKRARGDEVFALDAEVLGHDGVAVEGVEGDVGAVGE